MNTLLPSSGLMAILKQPKENQFQVKVASCYFPLHWEKKSMSGKISESKLSETSQLDFHHACQRSQPFRDSVLISLAKYQQLDVFYLLLFPPKAFCHSDNRSLQLCLKRGVDRMSSWHSQHLPFQEWYHSCYSQTRGVGFTRDLRQITCFHCAITVTLD